MPDLVSVAQAFGLKGVAIRTPDNLEKQIQQVVSMNGSVVCNVLLEEDYFLVRNYQHVAWKTEP